MDLYEVTGSVTSHAKGTEVVNRRVRAVSAEDAMEQVKNSLTASHGLTAKAVLTAKQADAAAGDFAPSPPAADPLAPAARRAREAEEISTTGTPNPRS